MDRVIDQRLSLAIAISLYDRWDELQGLLELLRLNWRSGQRLYIVVVSTAESGQVPAWVQRSLADQWLFGSHYTLPQKKSSWFQPLHDRRYGYFKQMLRTRTVDCVCRGCRTAAASGRAYTLHLHAAAWPLKEAAIYDILATVRAGKYVAAGRGLGQALVDAKHPAGDVDDNFFFIDNNFARTTRFWELDPSRDAAIMGAEGQIGRRLQELGAIDRLYYYDDFSRAQDYEYPPGASPRRVQPYNYHARLGLLRSHDMRWQAKLCRAMGYHGPFLDTLPLDQPRVSVPVPATAVRI